MTENSCYTPGLLSRPIWRRLPAELQAVVDVLEADWVVLREECARASGACGMARRLGCLGTGRGVLGLPTSAYTRAEEWV